MLKKLLPGDKKKAAARRREVAANNKDLEGQLETQIADLVKTQKQKEQNYLYRQLSINFPALRSTRRNGLQMPEHMRAASFGKKPASKVGSLKPSDSFAFTVPEDWLQQGSAREKCNETKTGVQPTNGQNLDNGGGISKNTKIEKRISGTIKEFK